MSTADDTEVCTQRTGEKTLIITMNPYKEAVKHVGPAITENQLKKWASDGHKARASTLANSSTIKGLLVSNENKKLKAIYMPRVVVDEKENSVLVGTISNHADKPKIRVLPLEALKSYFVVQTKANAPLGVPFGDEPLDLSHPAIASFFPTENEEHHLQGTFFVAKVPTAMPIPLNTSNIVLGDIFEQSVEETAMAIDEDWGMGWIECLRSANPGLSDILAKEPELQKYLPRTQSREMGDPYCTFEAPNDDDDNIAQAETKIIQECEDIVKTSKDTVPRMINGGGGEAPEQPNADGGNFGDLIRLMGQGFKNASNESEKASQLNANKKHFEGITKLMTAHLETDPRTSEKVLVLGKLSKCAQMIIDNATSVRSMSTIFEQGLSQTIRRHQDSENFLLRSVNFPVLEQAVKGFMGTGLYHQRTLKNLVITMLIPDTKDTSAKKKNNASDTIAEDAIGEAIEKRNKLSTAYTPVGALNCLEDLLAMLSNDITRLATLAEFDEFDMKNKEKVPFLVYASNRIAQFLTNRKAKDWMKDYKDTVRAPALFCFIAFRICAIVTDMAEALSPLDQTVAACEDRTMDISIEPYLEATSSLENTMDEIRRIILGTEIVSSPFFENSEAKKQHDKNQALKLRMDMGGLSSAAGTKTIPITPITSGSKRKGAPASDMVEIKQESKTLKKRHDDPKNLGADERDGYIIMNNQGTGRLKLPIELDDRKPGHFSLCKNFYIKGGTCRFGEACKNSHKHPSKLPLDKAQALWNFMASEEAKKQGAEWNTVLVSAKDMAEAGVNTKN